jgi:FkbM family methyltransferase
VLDALKGFVDRYPVVQRPAYLAYVLGMTAKNTALSTAFRTTGYMPRSLSDRGQDRWVIEEIFGGRRGGFFVELGAADGFSDSNTFVLERHYGWNGLAIEPNPKNYHQVTKVYRRQCTCLQIAVDAESGTRDFLMDGQRGGIVDEETDNNPARRPAAFEKAKATGQISTLQTMSLAAVFDKYNAPAAIDYFSFDVEGAETRILRHFPFNRYRFLTMTIERPTPELNALLFRNGYHFVRNSLYDTFYVHESLPNFSSVAREPFVQLPPKKF